MGPPPRGWLPLLLGGDPPSGGSLPPSEGGSPSGACEGRVPAPSEGASALSPSSEGGGRPGACEGRGKPTPWTNMGYGTADGLWIFKAYNKAYNKTFKKF